MYFNITHNYRVSTPFVTLYVQIGMYCSLKLKRYEKDAENIGTYRDHRFDSPNGDMLY